MSTEATAARRTLIRAVTAPKRRFFKLLRKAFIDGRTYIHPLHELPEVRSIYDGGRVAGLYNVEHGQKSKERL
jgi:hypothetical protein